MADLVTSMQKIVQVALMIKEAVETVRRNKEECIKIDKSVSRVTALLSWLQNTKMEEHPSMSDALGGLGETLSDAHTLVTACQERNIMYLFCRAGDLSKQLRQVHDDLLHNVTLGVFATTVQVTIILTKIQYPGPPEDARVVETSYGGDSTVDTRSGVDGEEGNVQAVSEAPLSCDIASSIILNDRQLLLHQNSDARITGITELSSSALEAATVLSLTALEAATGPSSSALVAATDNTSGELVLAQHGFDPVYKGVLSDGLVVAIKKFHNPSLELSDEQLGREVHHLFSMPEHKNVVRVLGYCPETIEKFVLDQKVRFTWLVEEYAPNGTLENIIKGPQLDWSSRFRIIQGIAEGVHYLHSAEEPIFHLDLKPENILLDSDMNPKIGDFGVARLSVMTKTQDFMGTVGYMPPEYIMHGAISAKSDVYSFGIILLETISGMSKSTPARHHASIAWAWAARKARRMNELFDPSLCDESQLKGIKRCMEIGLLCTQENRKDRPTMAKVVKMLNSEKKLPTPKQPGYTKKRS